MILNHTICQIVVAELLDYIGSAKLSIYYYIIQNPNFLLLHSYVMKYIMLAFIHFIELGASVIKAKNEMI